MLNETNTTGNFTGTAFNKLKSIDYGMYGSWLLEVFLKYPYAFLGILSIVILVLL